MSKNCSFTICSKNYLAQALTLKESFERHNPSCDFFIFLADKVTDEVANLSLVQLDESWIPKWREMAFKYDVIEFNTSIKPFCINKLFMDGYDKVIYLDPDIYVVDKLDYIYNILDSYDVTLTPHFNHIKIDFDGAVPDTQILYQGIYNLGFCAFRNSEIGQKIIRWWMKRLEENCYGDQYTGLFVDQKWMEYIPMFYPKETYIMKHAGVNVAIWNLHERTLVCEGSRFYIDDCLGERYPLLFYHFSGFDPGVQKVINRRHPKFNTDIYPSFVPLIEEYREVVYSKGYDSFHSLPYAFNFYSNDTIIHPMHRGIYKALLAEHREIEDPFNAQGELYALYKRCHLLLKGKQAKAVPHSNVMREQNAYIEKKYIKPLLKMLKNIVGISIYSRICGVGRKIGNYEYHLCLLK